MATRTTDGAHTIRPRELTGELAQVWHACTDSNCQRVLRASPRGLFQPDGSCWRGRIQEALSTNSSRRRWRLHRGHQFYVVANSSRSAADVGLALGRCESNEGALDRCQQLTGVFHKGAVDRPQRPELSC